MKVMITNRDNKKISIKKIGDLNELMKLIKNLESAIGDDYLIFYTDNYAWIFTKEVQETIKEEGVSLIIELYNGYLD